MNDNKRITAVLLQNNSNIMSLRAFTLWNYFLIKKLFHNKTDLFQFNDFTINV